MRIILLQASGPLIDPQLAGALIVGFFIWAGWVSITLVRILIVNSRLQPILEVFYKDLGDYLTSHPGHHSLSPLENDILTRFQKKTSLPTDEEIEILRVAADRERKDQNNPIDLQIGYALLQGACRSEQEARKAKRFLRPILSLIGRFTT